MKRIKYFTELNDWWKNGELEEGIDSLSGVTNDIKITVDGDKNFVQRLIDNLSLIVKKRSTRPLRVKSINGYVNKETFARHKLYYDTYLEIKLINKDIIVGEYNSASGSITIKVNDHIIYDMDSRHFDNEVLIDKIVGEYKKFLKDNRFIVNESKEEDEIIYMKDLYDNNDYLFITSLELKKMIKGKYIKIQRKIDGEWKNITDDYFKVNDVNILTMAESWEKREYNYDILIYYYSNEKRMLHFNVNKKDRILVKPSKIIFSKEDPYGEEDWNDD